MATAARRSIASVSAAFAVAFSAVATPSAAGRLHSIAPAPGYASAIDAWLYFDHPLSVDCSPPRACYAKTQWVQAYVNCNLRMVAIVQVVSMDLNGNVVGHAVHDPPQFVRAYGHSLRTYAYGAAGDALYLVCGDYPERD